MSINSQLPSSIIAPINLSPEQLTVTTLKQQLADFSQWQLQQFNAGESIALLIHQRSDYIDALLERLWQTFIVPITTTALSLIAVGGYGRAELHPYSDIDILILSDRPITDKEQNAIGQLLSLLWDIKLHIGHSVRTVAECQHEARYDLTIYTNLLEARLIYGGDTEYLALQTSLFDGSLYSSSRFFHEKVCEQQIRHQRYHSSSYPLQPDLKSTPGGLRDIHIIQWIALRHFRAKTLSDMVKQGLLTDDECQELTTCLHTLWRLRFALHVLIPRPDDRLLFEHQHRVAKQLNYYGELNQPVEQMMKSYYKTARRISELNAMILALLTDYLLPTISHCDPIVLDEDFQLQVNMIGLRHMDSVNLTPVTIMRLFFHFSHTAEAQTIHPITLRLLRNALQQQACSLSHHVDARKYFLAILTHPTGMAKTVRLMHQHGLLEAYIPQWHLIVGQMQFDLFHTYTVDEHTQRVLQNLAQLADPHYSRAYTLCATAYSSLPDKICLYFAALFHDIAKGRGGDHAELGANDLWPFAQLHGLSYQQCELACWLVRQHLLMSITAQRRDIQDPQVIEAFCREVRSVERLRYLLCLTVADMCATNETLWNDWKQCLLQDLYFASEQFLQQGTPLVRQLPERITQKQEYALALLAKQSGTIELPKLYQLWHNCCDDYFLRHSAKQLAWHAKYLLSHDLEQPLVLINKQFSRGGTELFIYSPDRPYLFAMVVGELDRRHLAVHDAQIFTHGDGMVMDTFIILDNHNQLISVDRHADLQQILQQKLTQRDYIPHKARRLPLNLRHFSVETKINYLTTHHTDRTYLELTALDRPGLLAQVGEIFARLGLYLHGAKISTIGERAKDLFILASPEHTALSHEMQIILQQKLLKTLSSDTNL